MAGVNGRMSASSSSAGRNASTPPDSGVSEPASGLSGRRAPGARSATRPPVGAFGATGLPVCAVCGAGVSAGAGLSAERGDRSSPPTAVEPGGGLGRVGGGDVTGPPDGGGCDVVDVAGRVVVVVVSG